MSVMSVKIGEFGDEMVGQALLERASMNFGELPRTVIPVEPTISRRTDPMSGRLPAISSNNMVPSASDNPILLTAPEGSAPFSSSTTKPEAVPNSNRLGTRERPQQSEESDD